MFIAEIGLNHKGSEERAFKMLENLVTTEVDAVTFQIPEPSFYEKTKEWGLSLPKSFYQEAINFVHNNNKLIGFAVADKHMIDFLTQAGTDFYKSLSSSLGNDALLRQLQETKKPLFVSTGLSGQDQIVAVSKKLEHLTFIHTQLSPNIEDSNIKAIEQLRNVTKRNIAFGLHCKDGEVLYLSIAFEPSDIFFYVKDNVQEKFPDDEYAIVIDSVDTVIKKLKKLKKAIGDGIKRT